jgi:hypothetical protein
MTFGYIGYIWALMGCGTLFAVFGASAIGLYAWSRRSQAGRAQPTVRVDALPVPGRTPPPDAA